MKIYSRMGKHGLGFTLIEMLVVMTLVALLMTLALPRYFGSLERSKETALRANLKVLRSCIDKYAADKGRFPETLEDLVSLKYLRSVPVDPVTESDRSWITVQSQDSDKGGIGDVRSGAPGTDSMGNTFDTY